MKNKILKLFCTSAVLCAGLLNAGVINAEEEGTYTETVINNIGLGNVAISLREYMHDAEGNEIPFVNPDAVVPNETITKIAKITNDGNKAWIRAKVSIESEDGLQVDKTLLEISDDKNWLSVGDYYYYTKPVDTGETVTILKSVYVPAEWGSETARKKFNVIVQASPFSLQIPHTLPSLIVQPPSFLVNEYNCFCLHFRNANYLETSLFHSILHFAYQFSPFKIYTYFSVPVHLL